MKRLILITILLTCAIWSISLAETYYVRAGGSWANNGTSWATAWNHPNRTNYAPFTYGDTAFIAPGEYDSVRVLPPRGGTSIRTVYACSSEVTGLTYETRLTSILHSGNVVSGDWGDFATGVDSIYLNPTTLEWVAADNNLVLYQRISGTKDSLMICVNSTGAVNANGEYYYDRPNDKLYVQPYGGGAASSYTFRYATKPIYQSSYEDQDNILLYGLDFRGGYQTVILLADGTAGAGDSVEIRNCNIGFSMVYSASNPSAIGCAAVYENNYSSWMRYLKVVGCTLHSVANTREAEAVGLHSGWGMLLYSVRNALIDSCVFINLPSSIGLKMGNVEHYGINADSIFIRNSFLYGGASTNLWVGNYVEGVEVTGCVIGNNNATQPLKNLAFFTSSSSSAQDFMGGAVITNNTFIGGSEAIVQLRPHNSNGGNIFKYNIIYDPTGETSVGDIDISDDDYGTENPSSETYWDIDSNQYWFGANTFDFRAQQAASVLNGQTSWAQWQAGGFDANSVNNVDPGLTVSTGVTTNAVAMTSQTYAGKTWTVYGAIQPSAAPTYQRIRGRFR